MRILKGGRAYILHPLRILMRLRTEDAELMQIAVLHDVIEDTEWTLHELVDHGFSPRVITSLGLLTHHPKQLYSTYISFIGDNEDATRIKLEDLRDNSDITRLKGVTQKDIARMEKYHKAYIYLKEQRF